MNYWDIENKFYQFSDPSRMMKIVYHYEIYKMIVNLRGQIIECGVFKGNSLSRFLSFRKHLEQQRSRSIIGFDIGAIIISAVEEKIKRKIIYFLSITIKWQEKV